MMKRLGLAMAILLSASSASVARDASDTPDIKEWTVPYDDSRPRDPFAVSPEAVWFVGQLGGYLARLDATTGRFEQVDLGHGAGPHNLIVGRDGRVWYTANLRGFIGVYDPASGETERIDLPAAAIDPHTLVFDADESHAFFTVQGGNMVGRVTVEAMTAKVVPVPTDAARPYGIRVAPDGTVWATLFGTNKLAEIDPKTLAITEHEVPEANARPRRLAITGDGQIWFVDFARGRLGRYDPAADVWEMWDSPSGDEARPYGMAKDGEDRLWFVETGPAPNRFVGFDPVSRSFIGPVDIPSGGGTVRHMHYHEATDTIWFGTDANTIGRAALPD